MKNKDTKKSTNCKTLDGTAASGWNKLIIDISGININAYLYSNSLPLFKEAMR